MKLINSGGIFREPFLSHTVTLGHFISSKETAPRAFWKPQVEERWKSRSSWEWLGHPTPANEMSSHPWAGSETCEELWLCRWWPPTYSPGSEWTRGSCGKLGSLKESRACRQLGGFFQAAVESSLPACLCSLLQWWPWSEDGAQPLCWREENQNWPLRSAVIEMI